MDQQQMWARSTSAELVQLRRRITSGATIHQAMNLVLIIQGTVQLAGMGRANEKHIEAANRSIAALADLIERGYTVVH